MRSFLCIQLAVGKSPVKSFSWLNCFQEKMDQTKCMVLRKTTQFGQMAHRKKQGRDLAFTRKPAVQGVPLHWKESTGYLHACDRVSVCGMHVTMCLSVHVCVLQREGMMGLVLRNQKTEKNNNKLKEIWAHSLFYQRNLSLFEIWVYC